MCLSALPTYMHVPHVCSACGGQKRVLDPLELQLQMIVGCYWVLETWPSALATNVPTAEPSLQAHPYLCVFNQGLFLRPGLTHEAGLAGQQTPGTPSLAPAVKIACSMFYDITTFSFLPGCWGLNQNPHAFHQLSCSQPFIAVLWDSCHLPNRS